jgi:hypothetical protein
MSQRLKFHRLSVALASFAVGALSGCSSSDDGAADPSSTVVSTGVNTSSSTSVVNGTGGAVSSTVASGSVAPSVGGTRSTTGGPTVTGGTHAGVTTGTGGVVIPAGGSPSTGGSVATGGSSAVTPAACTTEEEKKFSFFLVSQAALQADSGQADGYGGNLGGLTGADAICQRVAEKSSPCQKSKTWHAFLSTSTVNAKDRIGSGPWYDRLGRLLATNMTNLLAERPTGADAAIANDFPNEDGVPNHSPNGSQVDNHEILTGTGTDGKVYTQSASGGGGGFNFGSTSCGPTGQETWTVEAATCWGWTSKEAKGCPRVGHSWPREGSGIGWISVWNESGCAPGGTLTETMTNDGRRVVGSYGGYGGFYCFAVTGK